MVFTRVGLDALNALTGSHNERLGFATLTAAELRRPLSSRDLNGNSNAVHTLAGADRDGLHDFPALAKLESSKGLPCGSPYSVPKLPENGRPPQYLPQ